MHHPRRPLIAVALALCLLAACFDEFNGTTLDATKWYPNRWFASQAAFGADNTEAECYRPSAVGVHDGTLVITATPQPNLCAESGWSGARQYVSGWIQTGSSSSVAGKTATKFSFKYGHVDVRLKGPAGAGFWPAVWMLADDPSHPSRPEVDILEQYGCRLNDWNSNLHFAGIDTGTTFKGPDYSQAFHTVSLDWQADHLDFLLDGQRYWHYTGPGIPQQPMYLIINLAVGGYAGGCKGLPGAAGQLVVDWVHITQ